MKPICCYICGCARNVGPHLEGVFENIKKIISNLDDYHIIIAYDESHDNSLELLKSYARSFGKKMTLIIGNKNKLTNIRTQNIANARNKMLDIMRKKNDPLFDYFIMMDMDEVCSVKINEFVFKNIIYGEKQMIKTQWDALSFNRIEYYDLWALSIEPYSFSCHHYKNINKIKNQMLQHLKQEMGRAIIRDPEKGLVSCISAFNGFAIYKLKKFIGINYEWNVHKTMTIYPKRMVDQMSRAVFETPVSRHDDCEHRYFHIRAKQLHKAHICISPMCLF